MKTINASSDFKPVAQNTNPPKAVLPDTDPPPSVTVPPQTLLAQLRQMSSEALRVSYHEGTGKVRFIGTDPTHPIPHTANLTAQAQPEEAARAFLTVYGSVFGLVDQARELKVQRTNMTDSGRSFVRFQQTYQDIPILGGELIVQMDEAKNVVAITGEILPDLALDIVPSIAADEAKRSALETIAKDYGLSATELVADEPQLWIYHPILLGGPGQHFSTLVWRTEVRTTDLRPIRELVLIDAQLGNVALNFNQIDTIKNRRTYDANNGTTLPGTLVCDESNPTCTGGDAHEVAAHAYAGAAYDFYFAEHGRDSIDNAGMTLTSTVHYDSGYNNAYWHGEQMVYGDGDDYPLAEDVVAHELTHGVTQHESQLFYFYQSGAINEAFSDLWGEFVDLYQVTDNDVGDTRWEIGEDLSGGAIRNMQDPTVFGDPDRMTSPNYYCARADNGGVHFNNGVNSKAVYLMTDGDTFNGYTVTGIGYAKVADLYYEVQTNLLTSAANYDDLYDVLLQACNNLGYSSADCQEVQDALDAVEMNQPASCSPIEAPVCDSGTLVDIFFDDIESGNSNWAFGSNQGTNYWFVPQTSSTIGLAEPYATSGTGNIWGYDQSSTSDTYLAMNSDVVIPADAYLHFNQSYGFDASGLTFYDGGVLEYSTNGGSTWNDAGSLFVNNGYNGTISTLYDNPLGGRASFGADSQGYGSSRLDLSSLAGNAVRFRFRIGTDSIVDYYGWFIDDVRIYTCFMPSGRLQGTVLDSATAAPIAGAQIEAVATLTQTGTTTSIASGAYSMTLPVATYVVTASAPGYAPASISNVSVVSNGITIQDFALMLTPPSVISGTVTDALTGWPLYASLDIAGYAGGTLWNDPVTGFYSVTLTGGDSYIFSVDAWTPGYDTTVLTIGPVMGDQTENITLFAAGTCNAPGYVGGGLSESFEGIFPPTGWTVIDNVSSGGEWDRNDAFSVVNRTNYGSGYSAAAEAYTSGIAWDTELRSPSIDMNGMTPQLTYASNFQDFSGNGEIWLDISTNSGATWTNLRYQSTDDPTGGTLETEDLSAYATDTIILRWRYAATSAEAWYWHIDDVVIPGSCTPQAGGLVIGNVYDANTHAPLAGATVSNDSGESTTTATTADPAEEDAFYVLFSPSGARTFTATMTGYGPDTAVVTVVQSDTVRQDFNLPSASLSYTPPTLEAALWLSTTKTIPFTLTNSGGAAALFELQEEDLNSLIGTPAYGVELVGDNFVSFMLEDATNLTNIAVATQNFYAGDFIGSDYSTLYAIDDATQMLYAITTATGAMTVIGSSVPQSGHTWTGMSGDTTTGVMYATSSDGTVNTLYTLNLATGTPTVVGSDSTGPVIIDIAINGAGEMYGVDIIADELVSINKATGAVTSIGLLGFNANYAQSMDFDEATDTLYLVAYNGTSSSAELRTANTGTGATTLVSSIGAGTGVELDAVGIAAPIVIGDIPWLSEDPISGTLPAANYQTIDITFDATVVTQTGTYTGTLHVLNNSRDPDYSTPVTMHVVSECYAISNPDFTYLPASPMAGQPVTFTGTASGTFPLYTWNFGDGETGSGATITHTFMLTGSVNVTMTASSSCTESQQIVTQTLIIHAPDIVVAPPTLTVTLYPDESTNQVLTLNNTGDADLTWSLAENPDATWLDELPTGGQITPGNNTDITVGFSAAGLGVGTYNTLLHITSNDFDEPDVAVPVILTVTPLPISGADFTYIPPAPVINEAVQFTGSVVSGTAPINYAWNFDEGNGGNGQVIFHTFAAGGDYTVVMTASNAAPDYNVVTKTVHVGEPDIVVVPPTLSAALVPGYGTVNATLTISNVGDSDLTWSVSETPTELWLRESSVGGVIIPGAAQNVAVTFEATGLTENVYTTTLQIASDDPDTPLHTVPVTLIVDVDFALSPGEDAWSQVADDGINTPNNTTIIAMKAFGSYLYASTWNPTEGAAILRSTDGKTWSAVVSGGFGNVNNIGIYGLAEYDGYLYVGTRNDDITQAPQIWRSQSGDPGSWEEVPNTGLGDEQLAYWSLLTYNGQLWAGCATGGSRAELWKYNSATTNWTQEAIMGFDDANNGIYSLVEFQGDLYIGTSNAAGAEVWQRDGTTGAWTKVTQNGFGNAQNQIAYTMRVYNDVLYVGTLNEDTGAELYATSDGIAWELVFANGFDDTTNIAIWNMLETGGYFYLATESAAGGRIYRTNNERAWEAVSLSGFGNPDGLNARGWGMAIFDSLDGLHLYVGTDNPTGAEIWRTALPQPEEFWTPVEQQGFDNDALNFGILDYVEYDGALYAAVANAKGAQVWRTTEGDTWTQVGTDGLGDLNNVRGYALTVHNDRLYIGTENNNGAGVYRLHTNGVDWEQINLGGFGDVNNRAVYALASFSGYLYAGTWNFTDRAEVWRYNGSSWENISPPDASFEAGNKWIRSMVIYGDSLYIGTYNPTGAELWRYTGTTWQLVNSDGQGHTENDQLLVLSVFDGYLYAGYSNAVTGGQIWRSQDGSGWTQVNQGGFGRNTNDPTNHRILSMAEWDGYLYVGTENHSTILGYAQNFENSAGAFTAIGSNLSWERGTPSNGPGSAHSGTQVWATNLNGNYSLNEQGYLYSPEIDLRAYAGKTLTLSWWQWLQTEAGYDIAAVAVSKDGGANWTFVYITSGDVDLAWTQRTVTLDPSYAVADFRMVFYLQSDGSITAPGWYIDDISIGIAGTGGEIWRTVEGTAQEDWEQVNTDGFSYQQNRGIWALEVFGDQLYAGTSNYDDGAEVWRAARPSTDPEAACCEIATVGVEMQGAGWLQAQTDAGTLSPIHAPNAGIYDIPIKAEGDYNLAIEYMVGNQAWTQPITVVAQVDGALQISHGDPAPRMGMLSPTEAWTQVATDGVNDTDNTALTAMTAFNGYLYASTCNGTDGASIVRSPDGQTWGPVVSGGFGNANNWCVYGIVGYNACLYVGIRNDTGQAKLYKSCSGDPGTWLEVANSGLGAQQTAYWSLLNYNALLWAGCSVAGNVDTAELWTFNTGDVPNRENIPGFDVDMDGNGEGDNAGIYVMSEFQGNLYIGTKNFATGAEVWRRDISTGNWTRVVQNGFDDACNTIIYAMEVYNDVLYVGTYNACRGAELHATHDGNSWETIFTGGFDNPNNVAIWRLIESNGYLYLGTQNTAGGQVYRTVDGNFWSLVSLPGFGSANNTQIWGMETFQQGGETYLYAGTANTTGGEIWRTVVPQPQESWMQVERAGLDDDDDNREIWATVEYNGFIYVGTYHATGGAQVWRSQDGRSWLQVGPDGLDNTLATAVNNRYISALAVHNNQLYAGIGSGDGARVYRWNETGAIWEQVNTDGFGTGNNQIALELISYGGSLYAGTYNSTDSAKVFQYTGPGLNWTAVSPPLEASNWWIDAMTVYSSSGQSYLYLGTYNATGGEIWRYNGSTWEAITTDGFGNSNNDEVQKLLSYQGYLYAGLWNDVNGAQVWRSATGVSDWAQVNRSGFGRQIPDATNTGIPAMAEWNNYLYVGTQNATTGGEVWRTATGAAQADWEQVNTDGFGWQANSGVMTLLGFDNHIYAGTSNASTGAEIWRTGLPDVQPGRFAQVVNAGVRVSQPTTVTLTGAASQTYYAPTRGVYAFSLPDAGIYNFSADCGESFSIYLDMMPQVQFEQATYTVGEAEGTAIITAALDMVAVQTVTVQYTTEDSTATADEDYSAISGTLTFTPGVILQTFAIPILDDVLDEADETITLTLFNPTQAVIGSYNPVTLTIVDDEIPTVQFDAAGYSIEETASSVLITVALNIAARHTITVNYTTGDGSATANYDYTAISGTLTFTPGVTLQTFSVPLMDDALDEDNETVILTLSGDSHTLIGNNNPVTLTIQDNETPIVQFHTANYTVGETDSNATITVTLDIAAWHTVTVNYATGNGTATAGADYIANSGTLTFTPGVIVQNIVVAIIADSIAESDETLTLTLSDAHYANIGDINLAMLTITGEVIGNKIYLPIILANR